MNMNIRDALPGTVPIVMGIPGMKASVQLAHEVVKIVERDGWDQPTRLFWVVQQEPAPLVPDMFAYGVWEPEMPEGMGTIHPPQMLRVLAEVIVEDPGTAREFLNRMKWVGYILVVETWGVTVPEDDPEAAEQMKQDHAAGRLDEREDRWEMRMVLARFRNGEESFLTQKRGERPVDAGVAQGNVPNALRMLALATTLVQHADPE